MLYCTVVLWRRALVVITTAQLHSTKPEISFCANSNSAYAVSEIRDREISDDGPGWKKQKQFIIIIIIIIIVTITMKLCNDFIKIQMILECFVFKLMRSQAVVQNRKYINFNDLNKAASGGFLDLYLKSVFK